MTLHDPSVHTAYLLTGTMMGSALLLVLRRSRAANPGFAHWVAGIWLLMLAALPGVQLPALSGAWMQPVFDLCWVASALALAEAVSRFVKGRGLSRGARAIALLLLAVGGGRWQMSPGLGLAALTLAMTLPLLGTAALLLRQRPPELGMRLVLGAVLAQAAVMLGFGAAALVAPGDDDPVLGHFWPTLIIYVGMFLLLVGGSMGFLLATLERSQKRLRELAERDPLTGVLNRRALETQMRALLAGAQRGARPLAVLLLDIDHFKRINDTHGHQAGDAVLQQFAALLQTRCRSSDVLARIGGEEFQIVLPDTEAEGALRLAESLREAVAAQAMRLDEKTELRISCSIGIACSRPDAPLDADALYARADAALYAAKQGGRNRVELGSLSPVMPAH